MKLRITPVFPVKRFAAVSAQNVKNVQFDYTNMPTYNTITKYRTRPHRSAALAAYMKGRCAADSLPIIRSTPAIHVICRNTGGNQPCTLPPCALRYPKFIISLL